MTYIDSTCCAKLYMYPVTNDVSYSILKISLTQEESLKEKR